MKHKKVIGFFLIYFLLICSLFLGFFLVDKDKKTSSKVTEQEVSSIFREELAEYEKKKEARIEELESSNRWQPSKQFVMTAIILASILDIVIVLIWAWQQNMKRAQQNGETNDKKKWTDSKWFWYIIGLGIVVPKNNRLEFKWYNLVLVLILMYLLKTFYFERLFGENA